MAKMNQAMQDLLRYNAAILPKKRSSFNKSHSHTTTFDSAFLVPLMWDRVLPGDEKKIRYSGLARMATPIHPVMDEANLDVWAFYVPDRLWWTHAKEFYGENKDASFNPDGQYIMPYLTPRQYMTRVRVEDPVFATQGIGSLNDYFGFPTATSVADRINNDREFYVTAGLHRCYQLIWNEYYRNSSIQPALQLNDGDTVTDSEWSVIRQIRKVCKYPDYFTTLLREPQAGDDVTLPLGEWAPVVTRVEEHTDTDVDGSQAALRLRNAQEGVLAPTVNSVLTMASNETDDGGKVYLGNAAFSSIGFGTATAVYPTNLWADLTSATAATINNLRAAITVQQLLEIDSMAGKRYQQILQAHYGVFTPDATLQRPEMLGLTRTPIGMRQVLQTSATDDTSPQGNTAAFSLTNVSNEWICNKSFTEPGFIIVLGAVRPVQSYSQGLDPLLTKLNRYDHYYPVFDNLGNQPVPTSSIYFAQNIDYSQNNGGVFTNDPADFKRTFGYQEAWTEYRIKNNRVSGLMRPDLVGGTQPGSLASWNYSVAFARPPILNSAFVEESDTLVDRTIAVPSEPQFILDSYFDYIDVKSMGVHSIPGLLRL